MMHDAAPACPICASPSPRLEFRHSYKAVNLAHVDAPQVELTFWRCRLCGVVFTATPNRAASEALYDQLYDEAARQPLTSALNLSRYGEWLAMLEPYRRTGRLFESGFGRGEFMHAALEAGWQCAGNEISAKACELAGAFGVRVHCGDIATVDGPLDHDLVVALGAIEHTTDPHRQIQNYLRLLRPGGALFMSTPNYNSLSRLALAEQCRIFDPEHLFYFTPKTLRALVRQTGFTNVRVWTQNVNVHEVANRLRRRKREKVDVYDAYQDLRATLESWPALRLAKRVANAAVSALGVGEEMYVIAQKPDRA